MNPFLSRIFLILALAVVSCAWIPLTPVLAAEGETKEKPKREDDSGGEQVDKKKAVEDVSGGRFNGDPVYVHLSPMVLPIITEEGAEQLVTLIIDVEVKDFDVADKLHTEMPKVKDALVRALYGGLGKGTLRKGKLVDVNKIKAKAMTALSEIYSDGIKDVLIQSISQRML